MNMPTFNACITEMGCSLSQVQLLGNACFNSPSIGPATFFMSSFFAELSPGGVMLQPLHAAFVLQDPNIRWKVCLGCAPSISIYEKNYLILNVFLKSFMSHSVAPIIKQRNILRGQRIPGKLSIKFNR